MATLVVRYGLKGGVVRGSFLKTLRYVFWNGHPAHVSVTSETECFITDESLLDVAIVVRQPYVSRAQHIRVNTPGHCLDVMWFNEVEQW